MAWHLPGQWLIPGQEIVTSVKTDFEFVGTCAENLGKSLQGLGASRNANVEYVIVPLAASHGASGPK